MAFKLLISEWEGPKCECKARYKCRILINMYYVIIVLLAMYVIILNISHWNITLRHMIMSINGAMSLCICYIALRHLIMSINRAMSPVRSVYI